MRIATVIAGALRRFGLAALALVVLLAAAAPAAAQNDYKLGSGDKVRITVFGEPDLSGEFELGGDGTLALPLIGTVKGGGLGIRKLEERIAEAYRNGYLVNPQVGVEVLNYRPFYIIGEVNNPGEYPYRAGMTVINAVALAGGFTFRADEDDITIARGAGRDGRPVGRETIVQPGDVVRVKERFF